MARANASPITAKSTSCSASQPDIGADIQDHALPAHGWPDGGNGRAGHAFDDAQAGHRHRHQRAGVAGRDHDFGLPVFTDSIACHMLELRPRRSTWLGFSSMLTTSGAWRISARLASLRLRLSKGLSTASSPCRMKRTSGMTHARDCRTRPRQRRGRHRRPSHQSRRQFAQQSVSPPRQSARAFPVSSSAFTTSRPSYWPQEPHTWCGRLSSPQFGHSTCGRRRQRCGASGACCAATARFFALGPP